MTSLLSLPINLSYWGMQSVAMLITALLIPRFKVSNPLSALMMVAALAFVNAHVWDSALFFKVPDSFSSQTVVLVVSNAVLFWVLVKLLPGVEIKGIIAPLLAPLAFTVISVIVDMYDDKIDWKMVFKETMEFISFVKSYIGNGDVETTKILSKVIDPTNN